MNIEKDLQKDGIEILEPIDTLSTTLIAKFVAEKLSSAFPLLGLKYDDLFLKISSIPMFFAKIPEGMAEANYFYKNSSIYFKQGLSIEQMQAYAIHEFLHFFQEKKDKKNYLHRLGLSDYTGVSVKGLGLNEAAVQYMTAKALKTPIDTVKYYGIEFTTNTPTCYPLICLLLSQMVYLTGEQVLFDSTLYSNDKFKNCFSHYCGEKAFCTIQTNFDTLLEKEEQLANLVLESQEQEISEKRIARLSTQTSQLKKQIQTIFLNTQHLILTSYFDRNFHLIESEVEIEEYRQKLYHYQDYLGTVEGDTYFSHYYIDKMSLLSEKYDHITSTTDLTLYQPNFLQQLWIQVKKLFASFGYSFTENKP